VDPADYLKPTTPRDAHCRSAHRPALALPDTAEYRKWMFDHRDGRRWVGYRAGTLIAVLAIAKCGLSAAQLALTPSRVVLELAG
jgi:hypothetical protein